MPRKTNSLNSSVGAPQAKVLVTWFEKNFRRLPWRTKITPAVDGFSVGETSPVIHRDPYATWISEIMLQQTQVSTVIAYFNRWMKRFPNIFSLAESPEEAVLEAWAGLGYYSRARNLLATAKIVVNDFAGVFPWHREELLRLKGIGEYTAGAIASLSFNLPEPILDGNLVRVFSRFYGLDFLPNSPSGKAAYWGWSRAWVESHSPALVNEALMELGAVICTPKQPVCHLCPLARHCIAVKSKRQLSLPPAKTPRETVDVNGFVVVAIKGKDVLLNIPRKPELLAGLLTFPIFRVPDIKELNLAWIKLIPGQKTPDFIPCHAKISHSITHHRIRLNIFSISLKSLKSLPKGFQWERIENLERILVSALSQKVWTAYSKARTVKGSS